MADAFACRLNVAECLDQLDAIAASAKAAIIPAAQAGAQVFYDATRANVAARHVSKKGHWFYGASWKINGTRYWFEPGTLLGSIYQVRSKSEHHSAGGGTRPDTESVYQVSWNHRECPYGFMVEYGTKSAPAHPFLRPAFDTHQSEALERATAVLTERMKALNPGVVS